MQFHGLADRLASIRDRIERAVARGGHGQPVTVVGVTKTHGAEAVSAAWAVGLHDVGENRVQEALAKMDLVAEPVRWHLIGHLQRNKVRSARRFSLIHSVDSDRLAQALSDEGSSQGVGRPLEVLIQVNTSGEVSKGGYSLETLDRSLGSLAAMQGLSVRGVMTMAPFDASEGVLRETFSSARGAREMLRGAGLPAGELSMGMSGDFETAVEEGATIVRIGTILFGEREE
ncbi:MAG: YggS family pyridoxal phosphate-dependent enzyme [Gemmatimonadota bacterium]